MSEVRSNLQDFYRDYYADQGPSAWRAAGARDKANHILAFCSQLEPESILEVGSGEGSVLTELSNRGFGKILHGVDISETGVATTVARMIPRLSSIQVFNGYALPFENSSIDLVYATHVLEHVEHERRFLHELARVGRHVFVEVPLEDTLRVKGAVHNSIGHINFYNRHTLTALLESAGLYVEKFSTFDHPLEIQAFATDLTTARFKMAIRSTALRLKPAIAEKIFVYHAAALCTPANARL